MTNANRRTSNGKAMRAQRLARARWILAAIGTAAVAHSAIADDITLKRSVRLAAGTGTVRLSDVAEISGPEARRHGDLIVAEIRDRTQALELDVRDVRDRLSEAGVHWGKVALNGCAVIIRPAGPAGAAPPMAMTAVSLTGPAPAAIPETCREDETAEQLIDAPTLRGEIARAMVAGMGVAPDSLRLTFDDRDDELLGSNLQAYRFEIQPLSNLDSDRVDLGIRVWAEGRVVHEQSVTLQPAVRQDVVVLRRDINRGDVISDADCTVRAQWLAPITASTMITLVEAVGRVAGTPLKAGDLLKKKHVKREVLIKRGDRVMVRCLVGGVVVGLEAEARDDGAEGDRVELRKLGERNTFMGVVTGPSAAIVDLSH